MWAKVTLAELSTRNLTQRQDNVGGGNRAGATRSKGGASARNNKKKRKKTRGEVRIKTTMVSGAYPLSR